ncbi:MAG TPA: TonB-dependent siderophore receptor [Sphingomonas sp.]|nr:TonB-dependent siderophore receptor [Sphingomonas sp.]
MLHRSSFLLALSSTTALSGAAIAAEVSSDDTTIVVTGTRDAETTGSKTDTPLRDVPAAIAVVTAEVLQAQDVRGLDAALTNASAVSPAFGGGYGLADNYVIRGLPMRFLRDGLPDGNSFNGYRRTLADVAQIEVLKGPGSALYGRAEAGGSVNITTKAPETAFSVYSLASYGRFDSVTLTGDITAPLADGAAARLIGNYERSDGFRGLARRYVDVLPTVTTQLGDHALTFDYDHRDQRLVIDNFGIPFVAATRTFAPVDRSARFYSPFNRSDQEINRFTIADKFEATTDLTLRAAGVYETRDIDFYRNAGGNALNAANVMTGRNGRRQVDKAAYITGQLEAVWTPSTAGIDHTILLGSEYSVIDIDTIRRSYNLPDVAVVNGQPVVLDTFAATSATTFNFARHIRSETLSVYGQEQLALGDHFKIRGGIRYDDVKLVDEGIFTATPARIAGSNGLVSWQAGAVYQPSTALSFYAGYARGKFIAVNTEAANLSSNFARRASPLPENSSQVEAGFKAEPIAGKLQINGAVFSTKRDNFFVTLVTGADPVQQGRQRSRGAELDVAATPLDGLSVSGNLAYVDAVNRSSALVTVTGIAVNQPSYGKRLAATPKWSGNIWANYEFKSGALEGVSLGAGATFKSSAFADALELLRVPGYTVLRAAAGYRFGPVQAQVTVANLTDKTYYTVPTFSGALPGEPRSVQLTLRTQF